MSLALSRSATYETIAIKSERTRIARLGQLLCRYPYPGLSASVGGPSTFVDAQVSSFICDAPLRGALHTLDVLE
jgi:hypothetical protein